MTDPALRWSGSQYYPSQYAETQGPTKFCCAFCMADARQGATVRMRHWLSGDAYPPDPASMIASLPGPVPLYCPFFATTWLPSSAPKPLLLRHQDCGKIARSGATCSECGQPITIKNLWLESTSPAGSEAIA